jgi:SAM-dependent methyltransferase
MLKKFKGFIQSQAFTPKLLGIFFNPFYIARKNLYIAISEYANGLKGDLLDVGCGTKPYKDLFKVQSYIGLDIDSEHTRSLGMADYFYDGITFPFGEGSFDIVLCNQVLEHVFNPDTFLREVARVLKKNGTLLITVPFVWDEHEQPYDYARYTSFALMDMLKRHGFKIVRHRKLGADVSVIFQLINAYIFKVSQRWPKFVRLFVMLTIGALINGLGSIVAHILPANPDLFLDHAILAVKIND